MRRATSADMVYVYVFGERMRHLHFNLAPHVDGGPLVGGQGLFWSARTPRRCQPTHTNAPLSRSNRSFATGTGRAMSDDTDVRALDGDRTAELVHRAARADVTSCGEATRSLPGARARATPPATTATTVDGTARCAVAVVTSSRLDALPDPRGPSDRRSASRSSSSRLCLSTVASCDTLTTDAFASPASRSASRTLPGAAPS